MSAGHAHKHPNERHATELKKLLVDPDTQRLLASPSRVDFAHDLPYLAGYSVQRDPVQVYYLDQDFAAAAKNGQVKVPGMTPEQILLAVLKHEKTEKTLLDAPNNIDTYQSAHEMATLAEHELVKSFGVTPLLYERGLAEIIKVCQKKPIVKPPLDLDCSPYLDDPDATDKRILAQFKKFGVGDASKLAKKTVDYSQSKGDDRCDGCEHFIAGGELGDCEIVNGAIRPEWTCDRYQAGQSQSAQEPQAADEDQDQSSP